MTLRTRSVDHTRSTPPTQRSAQRRFYSNRTCYNTTCEHGDTFQKTSSDDHFWKALLLLKYKNYNGMCGVSDPISCPLVSCCCSARARKQTGSALIRPRARAQCNETMQKLKTKTALLFAPSAQRLGSASYTLSTRLLRSLKKTMQMCFNENSSIPLHITFSSPLVNFTILPIQKNRHNSSNHFVALLCRPEEADHRETTAPRNCDF